MKKFILLLLLLITGDLLFQRCANPKSPTGGPKDTIPPTLIESLPLNGTINFNDQEIKLNFSEYINGDKLKEQLIITPKTSNNYKSIIKKNQLIIRFDKPFEDSTTYNLNFADGVTDITEKNPVTNLSIAFSTGSYIDSMKIKGYVEDLFEQIPSKGYTVGLYLVTDTLDFLSVQPNYFTTTNDSGSFSLSYIKKGKYRILAFDDDNRNILLDPESESHGFLEEPILLDSAIALSRPIRTLLQNVRPLQLVNARPTGRYFEIKFNKTITKYDIQPNNLNHNLIGESKDIIRLYKPEEVNYLDSLEIMVFASDSLNNQVNDTLNIVFLESNRQPSSFSQRTQLLSEILVDNQPIQIIFNKPVSQVDTGLIKFHYDSVYEEYPAFQFDWNDNRTLLKLSSNILREEIVQTITTTKESDSLSNDGANPIETIVPKSISLTSLKGAYISIEGDTSKSETIVVPITESKSFGTIKFDITTNQENFTLQLLDTKNRAVYQSQNKKQFTIPKIKPGNYRIRVLIDNNQDDLWSVGNLLKNMEPEEIYLYPEGTSVRENWVLELSLSF